MRENLSLWQTEILRIFHRASIQKEAVITKERAASRSQETRQFSHSSSRVFTRRYMTFIHNSKRSQSLKTFQICYNLMELFQHKISTVSWVSCMKRHTRVEPRINRRLMMQSSLTLWRVKLNPTASCWSIKLKILKEKQSTTKSKWISLRTKCTKLTWEIKRPKVNSCSSRIKYKNMKIKL